MIGAVFLTCRAGTARGRRLCLLDRLPGVVESQVMWEAEVGGGGSHVKGVL
jgi:hypothetical protein